MQEEQAVSGCHICRRQQTFLGCLELQVLGTTGGSEDMKAARTSAGGSKKNCRRLRAIQQLLEEMHEQQAALQSHSALYVPPNSALCVPPAVCRLSALPASHLRPRGSATSGCAV